MLEINQKYSTHREHNFGKVFQAKVVEFFTNHFRRADADFYMLLQKPTRKGRDLKYSENGTERYPTYTRTRSADTDPEEHQRLENDYQKTVKFASPSVNRVDTEVNTFPELPTPDSSSDESLDGQTEDELAEVFEIKEPPSTNDIKTKFCEYVTALLIMTPGIARSPTVSIVRKQKEAK